ncbi:MAG TPA: hypothetical protein VF783_27020, partial [Terriglobales bacterium]
MGHFIAVTPPISKSSRFEAILKYEFDPLETRSCGSLSFSPAQEGTMQEQQIRAALDQHWAASDANDFETEHR